MKSRWQPFGSDESGGIGVLAATGLMTLMAMAALVVDLGHLYVVHRDVQKAAEAGASAGSRALRLGENTAVVDWDHGWQKAMDVIRTN
jgi:Flp pilus assembly protein TadG